MYKELKTKVCKQCGEEFEATRIDRIYCSSLCKNQYNHNKREKREPVNPRSYDYIQYNTVNNVTPLAGDIVRLTNDVNGINRDSLGIVLGYVSKKQDSYKIAFNPILPPYINTDKKLWVEGGKIIEVESTKLIHAKTTNMVFCYPDRKKADDMFLVNEFKTIL